MKDDGDKWKEYSYATDYNGQHYYFERWERLENGKEPRLGLRKVSGSSRDGVIVIMGDHFNYVLSRILTGKEKQYPQKTLVGLVDAAVEAGDLVTARSFLSIEGGHGRVSRDWKLDCAIPHWNEQQVLWKKGEIHVEGDSLTECLVMWKEEAWEIFDSSFENVNELKQFLLF